MGLNNVMGLAEKVDVAGEWGSKGSNEYSLSARKPRWAGQPLTAEARLAQLHRTFQRHSSYTEQLRQAAVTVSTCARPAKERDSVPDGARRPAQLACVTA